MVQIRDMLYVNGIERLIGRRLSEEEMDGDSHRVSVPGGRSIYIQVPILNFPYDLLTTPEELTLQASTEDLLGAA